MAVTWTAPALRWCALILQWRGEKWGARHAMLFGLAALGWACSDSDTLPVLSSDATTVSDASTGAETAPAQVDAAAPKETVASDGDTAAPDVPLAATGQPCDKHVDCATGICIVDKHTCGNCQPGELQCVDAATAAACGADGLWVPQACGAQAKCKAGKCEALACAPGATSCDGAVVKLCAADGSGAAAVVDCAAAGQQCVAGKCALVGCNVGATKCEAGLVATCADGKTWTQTACPAGEACDGGGCLPKVCEPGQATCQGGIALACNATGTKQTTLADCAAQGKFCNAGACADKACSVGQKACVDGKPATCKANGSGWDTIACVDADPCTDDTCDPKTVLCAHPKKDCDDANPCTSDGCAKASGSCTHAQLTGPCDDGSACTKGDQCSAGQCVADPSGTVTTVAGSGQPGGIDGPGDKASFVEPGGIAVDGAGFAFVTEFAGHRVRRIGPDGAVTLWAGSGTPGHADGLGTQAKFNQPRGIALDKGGGLFVAEWQGQRVRKIDAVGQVTSVAGDGVPGFADGPAGKARFQNPTGVAVDAAGTVYIADFGNQRIRKLQAGVVSTVAGSGLKGWKDGPAAQAVLDGPMGLAMDPGGTLWFSESTGHRVRRLGPEGQVVTVAGSSFGYVDGPGPKAKLSAPHGIAWSSVGGGSLILTDRDNHRVRLVRKDGVVSTLGGEYTGWVDGNAKSAAFVGPQAIAIEAGGSLLVADTGNHRVRRLTPNAVTCWDGKLCTQDVCDAKAATCNFPPIAPGGPCTDWNACTTADVCSSAGACLGSTASCDDANACTVDYCAGATGACEHGELDAACDDGTACTADENCVSGQCEVGAQGDVATAAGSGMPGSQDGPGNLASFLLPRDAAWGPDGSIFVADWQGHRVRKVTFDGKGGGDTKVTTWAGTGAPGGLDGPGAFAQFNGPAGVVVAKDGTVYVAESQGHRIRRITPQGMVSTLAGDGFSGFQDGSGTGARFNGPTDLVLDGKAVLYVADQFNNRIRKVMVTGQTTTVAGSAKGWKDAVGALAQLNGPQGLAMDDKGGLWFADTGNHRVRRLAPDGMVTTVAGTYAGMADGPAAVAKFNNPADVAWSPAGFVIVADKDNHRLRGVKPDGTVWTIAGTGQYAWGDGPANKAMFSAPQGVAFDSAGSLAVADTSNHRIRRVTWNAMACNDFDSCTADTCDGATGKCKFTAVANCVATP